MLPHNQSSVNLFFRFFMSCMAHSANMKLIDMLKIIIDIIIGYTPNNFITNSYDNIIISRSWKIQ